ncbi:hypothetical protein [Pseudozobellia thermophila]|uniref:Uncharacterized protein n=1 Tax=Pseudozobellia thermophila TaxID=192903 RepID=A0A1M6G8R7_9FLAO|nr:hypothetical protein [Pseudozobellia thermophila]SHJ06302.1 hypothetical protein SAMN04488513_102720 [Pseudozobellia thermophila]
MLIGSKCVASVLLVFVFMAGLVQEIVVTQGDDTSMAMELEHHDNPNDSEPDMDEDALDFDMFMQEAQLPKNALKGSRQGMVSYIDSDFQALKSSRPTPPPEYLG